jgi:hypothetical protein
MTIKFKSRLNVDDRKTIIAANTQLLQDYQMKRQKHFTEKIWKRNHSTEALSINNPNLHLPKRELLGSYLVLHSSIKQLARQPKNNPTTPFELPPLDEESMDHHPAPVQPSLPPTKSKRPPQLYQIYGSSKSSQILDSIVKSSQKGLLGQAMTIVQKRKEDSESVPPDTKTSVYDSVEKANSIYITDLTTRMIREEIERLQKLEIEKKTALKAVEKAKETDFSRFRENFEQVKRHTELTIDQSNEIIKKKTALVKEIKAKSQLQGIIKHDTKKLEDLTAYYSELKEFLIDLSPDYFKEKKARDMLDNQTGVSRRRRPTALAENGVDEQGPVGVGVEQRVPADLRSPRARRG